MTDSPQALYDARVKRFNDAVALRKPDRVPIASLAAFFMTRYAGLTNKEAMYDYEKCTKAWYDSTLKLNWDMAPPSFTMFSGPVFDILGLKTFKWPGHDYGDNLPYQFVEGPYMEPDEYDDLLRDPGDFIIRKYLPRAATAFAPLAQLPPIHWMSSGYTLFMVGASLMGAPPFVQVMETMQRAGAEMNKWNAAQAKLGQDLTAAGFPMITAAFTEAPFDWISDMLRGLRGIMLDMYRIPDKLLALIDLFTPFLLQSAIGAAQMTGNPRVFIPLHRGSGGFMSNEQYAKFYWPSLKKIILALIDAGLTPMPFLEGDYTPRLEFWAELPKGKVLGHFDIVDLQKAKAVIGDTMCFWGNVPAQILVTGTPQQTTDYVRKLIDTFGDNGGLIVDGAVNGVPDESKPENVEAMTEAVFKYGVY